MNEQDPVKKYMSELGKKSWEKQKKKRGKKYFRELQKKSVKARLRNQTNGEGK